MKPMTTNEILDKVLETKKGTWVRLIKSKDLGQGITKISIMTVRLGVIYSHMKRVGKTTSGSGDKLPWGEWLVKGLVISHNGELYLRVANAYTNNNRSYYVQNDKVIDKSMVVALLGEKKLESNESNVYNIKFSNILAIGK